MKGAWVKLTAYFLGTLAVSVAVTIGLPLLGGGSWLPDLISSEGGAIDDLFWGLTILSLVIFAIVGSIVVYSVVHFRAEPGDLSDGEHIHGNAAMEVAWIIIPTIIVSVIGWLSFVVLQDNEVGLFDKSAAKDPGAATMVVDVRGFSFGWNFRYEQTDGSPLGAKDAEASTELVLPVDQVVRFNVMSCSGREELGRLREQKRRELASEGEKNEFAEIEPGICEREWNLTTDEDHEAAEQEAAAIFHAREKQADGDDLNEEEQELIDAQPRFHGDLQYSDVNHAFWVPEARLKVDAVAGLRTYVQWKATEVTGPEDRYQVVCAELCGSGHNGMRTDVCILDADTFSWWSELDADGRQQATCKALRLFSCIKSPGDRDELLGTMAKLVKDSPEATCDDATEAAA